MAAADRPRRAGHTGPGWLVAAVSAWSLIFAAPHFYWAAGGRTGLGGEVPAADEAFGQSWFFAYNLVTAVLAVAGAAAAVVLATQDPDRWLCRVVRLAMWVAAAALLLRGAVGVVGLGIQLVRGSMDSPLILVAIEPWFLVGGVLFGVLAARTGPSRAR